MAENRGKQFEKRFLEDWIRTVPNSSIDRIYDSVSGFKAVSNISDFIAYKKPNIFYLECKSHLGNTFPIANLTQYEKLKKKVGIPGVRAGVVLWFIEHPATVLYIPISTFTKLIADGKKSFNVKMIGSDEYPSILIPSKQLRVFCESDYQVLLDLPEEY